MLSEVHVDSELHNPPQHDVRRPPVGRSKHRRPRLDRVAVQHVEHFHDRLRREVAVEFHRLLHVEIEQVDVGQPGRPARFDDNRLADLRESDRRRPYYDGCRLRETGVVLDNGTGQDAVRRLVGARNLDGKRHLVADDTVPELEVGIVEV